MVPGDKDTIRLIDDQLKDQRKYRELNDYFNKNQGRRWINRSKIFMDWLWKHRDAILQILGLILTYSADGSPVLRKVEDVEREKNRPEPEGVDETPDGEEVEDFVPELPVEETVVNKEKAESDLPNLKALNGDEPNPYDIGINEVQPEPKNSKEAD